MNKKSLIAIIVAFIVIGGGITYATVQKSNDKENTEHAAMMKKDEETAKMAKGETTAAKTGDAMMVKGSFSSYDSAKLVNAEKGKVVLFFSAAWCPTCQEANKNLNASSAPEGLTLLKLDYDNSNDLKKKYGVTYQHTYVQVDKDGNLIKKWSGSTTYDQIEKQLN
jgi:thiol-disulfide isomerase/thioredoxin